MIVVGAKEDGNYKMQDGPQMQEKNFSLGRGGRLSNLQGSFKGQGQHWQRTLHRDQLGYMAVADSCRRIVMNLSRFVDTKIEIVDEDVMLLNLGRPGEEPWHWIQKSRTSLDPRTRTNLVLEWRLSPLRF